RTWTVAGLIAAASWRGPKRSPARGRRNRGRGELCGGIFAFGSALYNAIRAPDKRFLSKNAIISGTQSDLRCVHNARHFRFFSVGSRVTEAIPAWVVYVPTTLP